MEALTEQFVLINIVGADLKNMLHLKDITNRVADKRKESSANIKLASASAKKATAKSKKRATALYVGSHNMTPEKLESIIKAVDENSKKREECSHKVRFHFRPDDLTQSSPIAAQTMTPSQRMLTVKTQMEVKTGEGTYQKVRRVLAFGEAHPASETSIERVMIIHNDLENYQNLPKYDNPEFSTRPVLLGPQMSTALPRDEVKQQNAVMDNLSAKKFSCIVYLLSKYSMEVLVKHTPEGLNDLCEKENFWSNAVWSHRNGYIICFDQMNPQTRENMDAVPESINYWMKNGEDVAQAIRKRKQLEDEKSIPPIEYSVRSEMAPNPETGTTDYVPLAKKVTQSFKRVEDEVTVETVVADKKDMRRDVGPREYLFYTLKTYLFSPAAASVPTPTTPVSAHCDLPPSPEDRDIPLVKKQKK